ncbi:hypothetical protein ODJ79_25365 [Actinoplanes sp. KI2]|uniref:hypothetical protein n=1 Tax=Actinoplanes sp. KI2 TaxID=2983315 RepID=UPI0021D5BA5C|nr:hypothetical protein [Actinoplanes sp. KI2]MCU7727070.1 hypothetical protein [Actinoplanes sp. KI2]
MRKALLVAGLPAVVVMVLAMPLTAVATQALRTGQADAGPVTAWPKQASSVLSGHLDLILRLVRCPVIHNGSGSVR